MQSTPATECPCNGLGAYRSTNDGLVICRCAAPKARATAHQRRAARLYGRITANVDAFHDGTVSYDEFNVRAIALWADIASKKMTAAVLKLNRAEWVRS